ncbi:unnamed protein product [Tenebrio molitor]|nr:unnamed protein product [Tenebrio molitor]
MTDLYVPLLVEIQFRYIIMKHKIVFHWYNMTSLSADTYYAFILDILEGSEDHTL